MFKSTVVSDMIKNEKYKGVYIYNQFKRQKINGITKDIKQPENKIIRVEGGIPAIVSEELWEAANSMNQKTKKASRNNSKVTYLLSGLIACGEVVCLLQGVEHQQEAIEKNVLFIDVLEKRKIKHVRIKLYAKMLLKK